MDHLLGVRDSRGFCNEYSSTLSKKYFRQQVFILNISPNFFFLIMETYLNRIKRLDIEFRGLSGKTDVFAPETFA